MITADNHLFIKTVIAVYLVCKLTVKEEFIFSNLFKYTNIQAI